MPDPVLFSYYPERMKEMGEQLDLFGSGGFPEPSPADVRDVESRAVLIANEHGLEVSRVVWKDNLRVMASVGKGGALNLHRIYRRASDPELKILTRVMSGKASKKDRDSFQAYLETHLPRELGKGKSRLVIMPPKGLFHDLNQAMERLQPLLDVPLDPFPEFGWSPARAGQRGITWGTHRETEKGPLILVNAILDAPDVPNFVIEHIVWQEICNQVIPPEEGRNGRRSIHSSAFHKLEGKYPRLREAEDWEQDQVSRYIRRHS